MSQLMPTSSKSKIVLGMMSGTSLDGLDLALVQIDNDPSKSSFQLLSCQTIPYPEYWLTQLRQMEQYNGEKLWQYHKEFGRYLGQQAQAFLGNRSVDLIASHGHTLFHRPDLGYTFQAGCGQEIARITGMQTVADFRSKDVSLGGQGAPLVPIGDRDLFSSYEACLNLGGFANIGFSRKGQRLAFDICPANYVLNHYARKLGLPYDKSGEIARRHSVNEALLDQLESLPYYTSAPPKSLGREWVEKWIFPLIDSFDLKPEEAIATMTQHIFRQLKRVAEAYELDSILVTGGGAYNSYLLELLNQSSPGKWTLPEAQIIEFKEAIIFAYLGWLRLHNQANCLSDVTGAKRDNSGGVIFDP
ncbi:anhydro-N-acetylmuramic acid kinase [bacterium SCSIO 12741]|nr:anhydro-N-acetylmuramic acid kinase [bacterium SCSIO 12741]